MLGKTITKNKFLYFLVATALAVAIFVLFEINNGGTIYIKNRDNGEVYASYSFKEGEQFAVSFIHSVNKTPVEDRYRITDGQIEIYETKYFGFGAGVQTELVGNQKLVMGDDGSMTITDIDTTIDNLAYNISPIYDHILILDDKQISLKQLCFPQRGIVIEYES